MKLIQTLALAAAVAIAAPAFAQSTTPNDTVKSDKAQIKQDKAKRKADRKAGDKQAVAQDKEQIKQDKAKMKADRKAARAAKKGNKMEGGEAQK
jgi:hypothetical protein